MPEGEGNFAVNVPWNCFWVLIFQTGSVFIFLEDSWKF